MSSPFEIMPLNGEEINWTNQFEKGKSGIHLLACQPFICYGDWGNMAFQSFLTLYYAIWYSRYKIFRKSGFKAGSSERLLEFSIQLDHSVSYTAKPFSHQTVKSSQFNIFYLPHMDSSAAFESGQLTTTLDIHCSVDYLLELNNNFPEIISPLLNSIEAKNPYSVYQAPLYATGFMLNLAGNIINHLRSGKPNQFLLDLDVKSLLCYALACKYELNLKTKRISLEQISKIYEIRYQLDTNLVDIPNIKKLAKDAHMSLAAFKWLFKTEIGDSPYHYWLSRKMDEARNRILNTTDSISKIAYDFGYYDVSNFSKTFKLFHFKSPKELREQSQEK